MATSNPSTSTLASAAENTAERLREAQSTAEEGIAEAVRRGGEAVQEVRDAWSDLDAALRETVRERPYAALAVAASIGFLYAVARGR
jgi:ElaB/YqjD/DUF883 family membrane-anchored ribosome-binding protein